MNVLTASNLSKAFGERVLFSGIDMSLSEGQKVALIARNGEGKTSLLKILTGIESPDRGEVRISRDVTLGYLGQENQLKDNETILEAVLTADTPIRAAVIEYEAALDAHLHHHAGNEERLAKATTRMDALDGWDFETNVKIILTHLGLDDWHKKIGVLSGGELKRVALAAVLVQKPSFMVLDEPTNHLDIDMIEWLEEYLSRERMTLLMVTHDRYFLDRIVDEILELEDNRLYRYKGNYEYYLQKKQERETVEKAELLKTRSLFRSELEWVRRMPRARGTKSKARLDAFDDIKTKAAGPKLRDEINLDVKMSRIGGKILEMKHVSKSYDAKPILRSFTYTFSAGERIGIAGPNGVGKSTFLNLITGREIPDGGKINVGETTVYGYFTQEGIRFNDDKRMIEVVKEIAEVIPLSNGVNLSAGQFLQHFGFSPAVQYNPVSKLSGGEKRRLHLLCVLITNPNFLILDEPTNDLDILTLNVLEEFLLNFKGCLLIVSHDRYFMDKLTNHMFVFMGGGVVKDINASYTEYRASLQQKRKPAAAEKQKEPLPLKSGEKPAKSVYKLSFNDKREYEQLSNSIALLEKRKIELNHLLSLSEGNYEELTAWSSELTRISAELDEKSTRWLELDEKIGGSR